MISPLLPPSNVKIKLDSSDSLNLSYQNRLRPIIVADLF